MDPIPVIILQLPIAKHKTVEGSMKQLSYLIADGTFDYVPYKQIGQRAARNVLRSPASLCPAIRR